MKKRKTDIEWLWTILVVVFFIYCLAGVMHERKTGRIFYVFGFRPVVILSDSMEPCLKTGSVVLVEKTKEIAVQDIIFFMTDKKIPVVHRYVGNDTRGNIITKGDANVKEDFEHIRKSQIEGKVVFPRNCICQ